MPLLALDVSWDYEATPADVSRRLVEQSPGEPWKGVRTSEGWSRASLGACG